LAVLKDIAGSLIERVRIAIEEVPHDQIKEVIKALMEAQEKKKKVLVIGMGRSGLVGKAFAMRLMHLGFDVHVVGETITPALGGEDILFAISGSGATTFVVAAAQIAKRVGAKVLAVTSYPASPLGELADYIVHIPGRIEISGRKDYFSRQILGEHEPLAPLGTLFEISAMIFLDSLIVELMKRLKKTEEEMRARHAVIE
jgi:6-phospho-3-hexuloisomerase